MWEALGRTTWGAELPGVRDKSNQATRIAIRLHGDGFRAYRHQKVMALTWRATSARGDSWRSRVLFTLIPVNVMIKEQKGPLAKHNTLMWALRHFARMLNILISGTFPASLPPGISTPRGCCSPGAGGPLCGPWTFAYAGMTGDLEFHRDANLHIASGRYYACNSCCSKCLASKTDPHLAYDDVSDTAGWRSTVLDTATYLAMTPAPMWPPAKLIHGWCHELCLDDTLHTLFLGVGQDVLGSAIRSARAGCLNPLGAPPLSLVVSGAFCSLFPCSYFFAACMLYILDYINNNILWNSRV